MNINDIEVSKIPKINNNICLIMVYYILIIYVLLYNI